jgi:hypothetical protein
MNQSEMKQKVDALANAALAKGLREPEASVHVKSYQAVPSILLCWKDKSRDFESAYKSFVGDTLEGSFLAANNYVESLPTPEQAKLNEFMACLGKVIDLGKTNGIEVEFLNPLTATMKRLSENALTFQKSAA